VTVIAVSAHNTMAQDPGLLGQNLFGTDPCSEVAVLQCVLADAQLEGCVPPTRDEGESAEEVSDIRESPQEDGCEPPEYAAGEEEDVREPGNTLNVTNFNLTIRLPLGHRSCNRQRLRR